MIKNYYPNKILIKLIQNKRVVIVYYTYLFEKLTLEITLETP